MSCGEIGLRATKPPLVLGRNTGAGPVAHVSRLPEIVKRWRCEGQGACLAAQALYLQGRSGAVSEEGQGPGVAEDLLRQRGGVHALEHRSVFLQGDDGRRDIQRGTTQHVVLVSFDNVSINKNVTKHNQGPIIPPELNGNKPSEKSPKVLKQIIPHTLLDSSEAASGN